MVLRIGHDQITAIKTV